MPRAPDYQKERGDRQIARILELLAEKPMTATELGRVMGLTKSGVHIYLRRLQEEPRKVRVCDYQRNGGRPFSIYGLGSGPDAELIRAKLIKKPKVVNDGRVQCEAILAAIRGNPSTVAQIAARLSVSIAYVRKYLDQMHAERRVWVSRWAHPEGRGSLSRVWAVGAGKDAPYPEYDRAAYHKRIQRDPERAEAVRKQRRIARLLRKAKSRKHGPFSALGL